ncbi:hypothetical protein T11_12813 [Trichinella zimbabwensis]|uniref:Uncharacterized protein n=1 Tax=Trichinella zimbabwensis TaxID=268475 RepID=A0A0V1G9B5_9BILA|nr:hypothetical protein T11_12813 [Trichinella zimbabwensis]
MIIFQTKQRYAKHTLRQSGINKGLRELTLEIVSIEHYKKAKISTGIDLEKSQNYNKPGRTLHESSFVEIVA